MTAGEPFRSPGQLPPLEDTAPPAPSSDDAAPGLAPARRLTADGSADSDSSTPFVATVRSRPGVIRLGDPASPTITIRVQMPEVWDTVRLEVPPDEPVLSVKVRALEALFPEGDFHEDFVLKLRGFEVLEENSSAADAGAVDGSIFLLTHRRRRPVR